MDALAAVRSLIVVCVTSIALNLFIALLVLTYHRLMNRYNVLGDGN